MYGLLFESMNWYQDASGRMVCHDNIDTMRADALRFLFGWDERRAFIVDLETNRIVDVVTSMEAIEWENDLKDQVARLTNS